MKYVQNPSKKQYIAQLNYSLDVLFSNGKIAQPEYKDIVKELKSKLSEAKNDIDWI